MVLHQPIINLECEKAFAKIDDYPDTVIGCAGGGSNLGGLIAPFMRYKFQGKYNPDILAVEPASCPSMTRGKYAYDFCDTGEITPWPKCTPWAPAIYRQPATPAASAFME